MKMPCDIKKLGFPMLLYILNCRYYKKLKCVLEEFFGLFFFPKSCKIRSGQNIKESLLAPTYCLYIFHCVPCECKIGWPIIMVVFW